jgi:hypothetical protein
VDGHRFDADGRVVVVADADAAGAGAEAGLDGFSSIEDARPDDAPVGGTRARAQRAGRQRVSGGNEKPDGEP